MNSRSTLVNNVSPNSVLRESTQADVEWMALRLRKADEDEIYAGSGNDPETALNQCLTRSVRPLTWLHDGYPAAMAGAAEVTDGVGMVWCLGTYKIAQYPKEFIRIHRVVLPMLQEQFPLLFNYVDARNKLHINYLEHFGFQIIAKHERFGFGNLPFYEFVRIA